MLYDFKVVITGTIDLPDRHDEEWCEQYIYDTIEGCGWYNLEKYNISVEDFVEA